MATAPVDVKYDEGLVKYMQELFIHKIVPENFLITVHKYDSEVLTMADIQRLRKMLESKSTLEVNYDVLCTMKNYKGWFSVILDVCGDSEIKQGYLADEFKRLKSEFDKIWTSRLALVSQEDNLVSQLEKLSLDSENEIDADGGAVCPPSARKSDTADGSGSTVDGSGSTVDGQNGSGSTVDGQNGSESTVDGQNGAKVGWTMNKGKGYCYACCVELTSEKLKDSHFAGRNHLKKMKEKGFSSNFDEKTSVVTTGEKGFNVSFDETKSVEETPKKGFSSSFDEAKSVEETPKKGFSSSSDEAKSVEETGAASDSSSEDWIKFCHTCDLALTSAQHSSQHMSGSKHKKKVEATLKVNSPKPSPTLGPNGEVSSVNDLGVGMCYLCGISITSREHGNLHFNGKKHKNMCKENGFE